MDFAVPVDHSIKLKQKKNEKRVKYLNLARELKNLCNMKVEVTPIVISALDTVNKGLLLGLEFVEISERVETIQTTALLRLAKNTKKSPEDLRRLDVILPPMKNYQQTLM